MMRIDKLILVLLFYINIKLINCQNEALNCAYKLESYGYTCALTIINPNGLNNFQDISGVHLNGKNDNDITYVSITSDSNTINIPSIICTKFQNLAYLELDNANITEINDYYFVNCKNLRSLFFFRKTLSNVYKNAFTENIQLQDLSLYFSGLTDLPANVFPKLGNNLTSLNLNFNKLKVIKLGWFKSLTKLEYVSFVVNLIEEIPIDTFINCKNLKSVDFTSNKLKVLSSKSFYDIFKLEYFDFHENNFIAIDEKFLSHPIDNKLTFTDSGCVIVKPYKSLTTDDFIECIENYRAWESGKRS